MSLNQLKLQATEAVVVSPSDGADLGTTQALIFVGVAGDIKVDCSGSGDAIVFKNVPAGSILPVKVDRVYSTGTSATNMVALY
jgi:hypothetical protein